MVTITKDNISGPDVGDSAVGHSFHSMPLYGIERAMGETGEMPNEGPTVEFRMYDDDGELYYEGILTDDDECVNQSAALRWGGADAGCTTIEVKRGNEWKQEIG